MSLDPVHTITTTHKKAQNLKIPPNIYPTSFLNKQPLPKLETHGAASLCLSVALVCAPLFTTHEDPRLSHSLNQVSHSPFFYYYFTISKNTHYLFLHLMQRLNFLFPFLCSICLSLNHPLKSSLVNTVNL